MHMRHKVYCWQKLHWRGVQYMRVHSFPFLLYLLLLDQTPFFIAAGNGHASVTKQLIKLLYWGELLYGSRLGIVLCRSKFG
jgi:hypothetical protein